MCARSVSAPSLIEIPVPINTLAQSIPDLSLLSWQSKGINLVLDLFHENVLLPFESLQSKFALTSADHFSYNRIAHFLRSIGTHRIFLQKEVWRFYTGTPVPCKGIAFFYNLFQDKLHFIKSLPYQKWESDLGDSFTDEQWLCAFSSLYKASSCVNHWELSQKIALRWYLTPYILSKFGKDISPLCWRNCGMIGNLLHMFWACKHLTSFWNQNFSQISRITGILTRPSPSLTILHLGIETSPPNFRVVVSHILLAARSLIAQLWKADKAPNVSEVLKIVQTNYVHESLLADRRGN